jgi:UDP-N-acetyl-D-galactosamine dehydrogenase
MQRRLAVVGLGYVGLPVALAFAAKFPSTIGFDISAERVCALRSGEDATKEFTKEQLLASPVTLTSDPDDLKLADVFIVCVPTPVHADHRPDLAPLRSASRIVGQAMRPGAIVVYESTVYPGVTEEVCGPILAECSGLRQGVDFKLGYSPERINPGDKQRTFERIPKVVSAEDAATCDYLAELYGSVVTAGVHRASSLKVAEAAKVLENTQRDLNIALMNEMALICDRLGIRTRDVLEAAATKWNFLKFTPGLVGGHCVGVDPYYLTAKAEELGYHPQVILAGRRINDSMGSYIAQKAVRLLGQSERSLASARVAILGLTFKEDVPDIRNSRVPDIAAELRGFGIEPLIVDPVADGDSVRKELGLELTRFDSLGKLDLVILAVPHAEFLAEPQRLFQLLGPNGILMDVKSAIDPGLAPANLTYWCL